MISLGRFLPWIVAGALAGVVLLPSSGAAQQSERPRAEWRGPRHHRAHPGAFARSRWMEHRGWRMEYRGWRMEHRGWRMERRGWRMERRGWRMEDRRWMGEHRGRAARRAGSLRHRSNGVI
jgi:hypothetical protein